MRRDGERRALGEGAQGRGIIAVPTVLAGALDVPRADVQLGEGWALEADLVVRAGGDVVDVLDAAAPGPVTAHAEHVVTAARKLRRKATPLPALPYMTDPAEREGEQVEIVKATCLYVATKLGDRMGDLVIAGAGRPASRGEAVAAPAP